MFITGPWPVTNVSIDVRWYDRKLRVGNVRKPMSPMMSRRRVFPPMNAWLSPRWAPPTFQEQVSLGASPHGVSSAPPASPGKWRWPSTVQPLRTLAGAAAAVRPPITRSTEVVGGMGMRAGGVWVGNRKWYSFINIIKKSFHVNKWSDYVISLNQKDAQAT